MIIATNHHYYTMIPSYQMEYAVCYNIYIIFIALQKLFSSKEHI